MITYSNYTTFLFIWNMNKKKSWIIVGLIVTDNREQLTRTTIFSRTVRPVKSSFLHSLNIILLLQEHHLK